MTPDADDGDELRAFRIDIERMARHLQSGCGLSYELYARRLDDAVRSRIAALPLDHHGTAREIAAELGHDPAEADRELAPGSCSITGIDIPCCPCGRHP